MLNAEAFKSGQSPILCATDVAARGLDIKAGFELNSLKTCRGSPA